MNRDDLITIPMPKESEIMILGETKVTMAYASLRILKYLEMIK